MGRTKKGDNKQITVDQMFRSLKTDFEALRQQNEDLQRQLYIAVETISRNVENKSDSLRKQNEDQQRQLKHLQRDMRVSLLLGRSYNAPETSKDTQFTQFMRIPLEIREMIWELAVPSRLLRVDTLEESESIVPSALSVPTVAHVCRESRRVFLSRKQVDGLTGGSSHLRGASQLWRLRDTGSGDLWKPVYWSWFTPHKDALLLSPDSLDMERGDYHPIILAAEHIIFDHAEVWPEFLRPRHEREETEEDMFARFWNVWDHFPPKAKSPPPPGGPAWNLRTVDFALNSVTKIDRNYPLNFVRRLFAGESVKIVDLRNTEAVRGIQQMLFDELLQCMNSGWCSPLLCTGLQKSLAIFKAGGAKLFKHLRAWLIEELIRRYHECSFVDPQKSCATLPSPFIPRSSEEYGEADGEEDGEDDGEDYGDLEDEPKSAPGRELDMKVTWVKEFTERFTIRPVHVFVRGDGISDTAVLW